MDGIKNAISEGFRNLIYEMGKLLQAQQSSNTRSADLERRVSELERRVSDLAQSHVDPQ